MQMCNAFAGKTCCCSTKHAATEAKQLVACLLEISVGQVSAAKVGAGQRLALT